MKIATDLFGEGHTKKDHPRMRISGRDQRRDRYGPHTDAGPGAPSSKHRGLNPTMRGGWKRT